MKASNARAAAFLVGLFSPYTVSLVGEMPVGELVLLGVLGWMGVMVMMEHRPPDRMARHPLLRWMLVCQAVAMAGYVMSDFVWHSRTLDEVRGWARMVFLAIDLLTLAYLFTEGGGRALLWLLWGEVVGGAIQPLLMRPLFGDYWKFGFGMPVSLAVLLMLPRLGFWVSLAATLGLAALHFALNFRSLGGVFFVLAGLLALQRMPLKLRAVCLPVAALLAVGALAWIANRSATANRSHDMRSDISRKAMLKAAWHGVEDHPFIGNGSWLGRSGVIDDYLAIRYATAQEEHLGGIGQEEASLDGAQTYTIHSQLLVALAEGGILGGAFFLLYGGLLVVGLAYHVVFRPWSRYSALYLFLLLLALFNLLMSPFSGVHRVYIATTCGLLLLLWDEYSRHRTRVPVSMLAPRWRTPHKTSAVPG